MRAIFRIRPWPGKAQGKMWDKPLGQTGALGAGGSLGDAVLAKQHANFTWLCA